MDVLLFQDRNELVKLLRGTEKGYNEHSKREMIERLYPLLTNEEELKTKFESLSQHAKRVALLLCYDKNVLLSKEELHGFAPKVTQVNFKELLNELLQCGILFSYVDQNFLVPNQIKQQIIQLYKNKLAEHSLFISSESEDYSISIVKDLFSFIEALEEKSLPITKNGVFYKKDFQSIMSLFTYKEALPNEKWRFGYGRRFSFYPDRFSLIYDYCFYNNWINENDGYIAVSEQVDTFYDAKFKDHIVGIVNYWMKAYSRPIPSIRLLYDLLINTIQEGESLEEDVIVSVLTPIVEPYYFDSQQSIIKKRVLQMLVKLDVLQVVDIGNVRAYTAGVAKTHLQ